MKKTGRMGREGERMEGGREDGGRIGREGERIEGGREDGGGMKTLV